MNELHKNNDRWGIDGIPTTGYVGTESMKWITSDSLENFKKNKPKGWTEDSIDYSFNSHGYRSVEFVDKSQRDGTFTVASYGPSNTFGVGVKESDTWPELFRAKMENLLQQDVINYNFGYGGASNDYIVRVMYHSLPIIKPDLVLVLLSSIDRRELYDEEGNAKKLLPSKKQYESYYENFVNIHESTNNFLKNVAFMKTMLDLHDIKYIFAVPDTLSPMNLSKQDTKFIAETWRKGDNTARDCMHSSGKAYSRLAGLFLDKYKELYV